MNKFIKQIGLFVVFVLIIQLCVNFVYLSKITKNLPEYRSSVKLYFDKKTNQSNDRIAVITCSNGEYNLEFEDIRKSIETPIDFYLFSGSTHFNFIDYIIENKTVDLSKYNKVILYLPYIVYEQSPTFQHRWGFYECVASKDYIYYLIKKSPYLMFTETWAYNYIDYKKTVKDFPINKGDQTILKKLDAERTAVVDSLLKNNTSYKRGDLAFNHSRFINKNEPDLMNDVEIDGIKWYVFLPPMPNIPENLAFKFNPSREIRVINDYETSIKDSSLFYDQWWHLNYNGRLIETQEFIKSLQSSKFQ